MKARDSAFMSSRVLTSSKQVLETSGAALRRVRDAQGLYAAGLIAQQDVAHYRALSQHYDIGITPHVLRSIKNMADPQSDPVGRQYIPSLREMVIMPQEQEDPIGDDAHSPVKGIVHRYPDRVLLKVSSVCGVYCRYCFRREMIGAGAEHLSGEDLDAAIDYIAGRPEIWEVILTGGDPLVLSARRLGDVMDRLRAIDHVRVIRIHTRIPVADPAQIDDTILGVLQEGSKPIYLVLHVNHAQEITRDVEDAFLRLRAAGCALLSQSVLLKGVNDDAGALEDLFKKLITLHVKPYYLHHLDLAKGTSHFRVSIARGQEIMRQLQGRISGICLPRYMLDIPGGHGKVPVEGGYCAQHDAGEYVLRDFQGGTHHYKEVL